MSRINNIEAILKKKSTDPATPISVPSKGIEEKKPETYSLRLYVAGNTPKSTAAIANLKKICAEYLAGRYKLDVIDLLENPTLARSDQILAAPTLVRHLPLPVRKVLGDLSNLQHVLTGLGLPPGK